MNRRQRKKRKKFYDNYEGGWHDVSWKGQRAYNKEFADYLRRLRFTPKTDEVKFEF